MKNDDRYELLDTLSQRENGEMPPENERVAKAANDIRRAIGCCTVDEGEHGKRHSDGIAALNELEKRFAEKWAKENDCWIPFEKVLELGIPGPSGSESDTYIADEVQVYKVNNLLHCQDSIIVMLTKTMLYNRIFPDTAYTFIGFTGFDGRSVYPIVRQGYVSNARPATSNEIDCYMAACGFQKVCEGRFSNDMFELWDVLPKNVLKDKTGDIYVIDLEIQIIDSKT